MRGPRVLTLDRAVMVITGANHPAALAIARRAAAGGAHLVLIDDDQSRLRLEVDRLRRAGATVLSPATIGDVRGEVEHAFGVLHIWIDVVDKPSSNTADVAWSSFGPRGGTWLTVDLLGVSMTSPVAPRHPGPVNSCRVHAVGHVHPDAIARSTLACLKHPRRDMVVGRVGRVMSALDRLLPRRSSLPKHRIPRFDGECNREALRLATRGHVSRPKSTLYGVATQHPWTTLAVAGAAALFFGSRTAYAPTVRRSRVNT